MFKVLRAVSNNLNKSKYLKLRSRIRYNTFDDETSSNNKFSSRELDEKVKKIDLLQTEVRNHNIKIFTKAVLVARSKQFLVYTLPAILLGVSFVLFRMPSHGVKKQSLKAFKAKETVFNEQYCIEDADPETIYYGSVVDKKFVNSTDKNISDLGALNEDSDFIYFRIRNELDGILARIDIGQNGELSLSAVETAKFIDLQNYDFSEAEPLPEEYAKLFDDVIELLQDSNSIRSATKESLLSLSANDKRDILVRIIEFEPLGRLDADIYVDNTVLKVVSLFVAALYIGILIYVAHDYGINYKRLYSEQNGKLELSSDGEEGVLFLISKYKEAFLLAEQDRVREIYKLYSEIVNPMYYTPEQLLTRYEKKLFL